VRYRRVVLEDVVGDRRGGCGADVDADRAGVGVRFRVLPVTETFEVVAREMGKPVPESLKMLLEIEGELVPLTSTPLELPEIWKVFPLMVPVTAPVRYTACQLLVLDFVRVFPTSMSGPPDLLIRYPLSTAEVRVEFWIVIAPVPETSTRSNVAFWAWSVPLTTSDP
jgi:hypothetical protein